MDAVRATNVEQAPGPPPALRHVVLVGGTPAEWTATGDDAWRHRLAELGKVADHVGASWLALYPYGPDDDGAGRADDPSADPSDGPGRTEIVGDCTVSAAVEPDGRARLVRAIEELRLEGTPITENSIAAALNAPAEVDPDLVVVLGPDHRLPSSLVWELAYSELVFIDAVWTDLQPMHLERAIDAYHHRHRRFGGLD